MLRARSVPSKTAHIGNNEAHDNSTNVSSPNSFERKVSGNKKEMKQAFANAFSTCLNIIKPLLLHKKRLLVSAMFLVLLWFCRVIMIKMRPTSKTKHLTEYLDHDGYCESPSLARGSLHIVVGGWRRHEKFPGISFSPKREHNYIWDFGLTNAEIFWYRRINPHLPLSGPLYGPCGTRMHERLLLPNNGRDATTFIDHVLEFYDNPPKTIIYLHGHAAGNTWHTDCPVTVARTTYYYRDLVRSYDNIIDEDEPRVKNHMMSLTAVDGIQNFELSWYGTREERETKVGNVGQHFKNRTFYERWGDLIDGREPYNPLKKERNPYRSCCINFILPGERVRRFPREFWEDLKLDLSDTSEEDYQKVSDLFEFTVYELLGDEKNKTLKKKDAQRFYDEADGLYESRNGTKIQDPDPAVVWRSKNCEQCMHNEYLRIRKTTNTFKKIGIKDSYENEVVSTWRSILKKMLSTHKIGPKAAEYTTSYHD